MLRRRGRKDAILYISQDEGGVGKVREHNMRISKEPQVALITRCLVLRAHQSKTQDCKGQKDEQRMFQLNS